MATTTMREQDAGRMAHYINVVLGVWLFISAFVWPHTGAARTNTWIVGLLIAAFAIGAMYQPMLRYVNAALAVWLFVSTVWIFAHLNNATPWNNAIISVVVFLVALFAGGETMAVRRRGPIAT